jgi:hypothetical protein
MQKLKVSVLCSHSRQRKPHLQGRFVLSHTFNQVFRLQTRVGDALYAPEVNDQ